MADLAAFLYEQAPFEHHVLAHGQNTLFEHRTDLVHKPVFEFGAAVSVRKQLDSKPQFGKRYSADVQGLQWLRRDECDDSSFWVCPPQF
jgi:hypothetical protein